MTRRRNRNQSKALTKWDEELAKQAEIAANIEANAGGGEFFSVKGGILSWQETPLPGNEMAVVIVDSIFENVFYEGRFNPDVIQAPTCFAFAHEEPDLEPHDTVVKAGQAQSTTGCHGCEHNEWGTAETGKGKACRNTRRLALLPAGNISKSGGVELIEDEDHYQKAAVGFLRLPVTSTRVYANFVKQVAGALKRPPHGIITRISVSPDPKNQFRVEFEPLDKVPDSIMGAIMQRRDEVTQMIDFPYALEIDEPAQSKPSRKKRGRRNRY